jgi:hypothetical protein
MPNNSKFYILIFIIGINLLLSCESAEEKHKRVELEKIELSRALEKDERKKKELESERARLAEEERVQKEKERIAQELYEKYINNSLANGATPYKSCFGGNSSCTEWGCSEIRITTPRDSDVIVTLKRDGDVVRHAYINANSTFTFQIPNGTYQPFFYYGSGWNPEKAVESNTCQNLKGGFIEGEVFGKDSPQSLNNDVLTYELILQQSGNFSTKSSSSVEAF